METSRPNNNRLSSVLKAAGLLFLTCIQYASSTIRYLIGCQRQCDAQVITLTRDCGGFFYAQNNGTITSPNYPSPYPVNTRCIWVLEAPILYQVQLTIQLFQGEESNTSDGYYCKDYIELRDGSPTSDLLFTYCGSLTSHAVTSTARWLWVLFSSDGSHSGAGLKATYNITYAGEVINNVTSPLMSCRTHEFSCPNRQCISESYRCDGYFDCGCANGNCDEDGCGGIGMTYGARLAMGIGIGVALFICICMFSLMWERRHNWARLNHKDDDKNRDRHKR